MDIRQAIVVAIVQGLMELFPVSSLGHAVLVPHLLGCAIDERGPTYLPFLVLLHVGTAIALLAYFWRDWARLLACIGRSGAAEDRRLLVLLILGTIPAGLVGLVLEKPLANVFAEPRLVAVFLALNGGVLMIGEWLRRRAAER